MRICLPRRHPAREQHLPYCIRPAVYAFVIGHRKRSNAAARMTSHAIRFEHRRNRLAVRWRHGLRIRNDATGRGSDLSLYRLTGEQGIERIFEVLMFRLRFLSLITESIIDRAAITNPPGIRLNHYGLG